MIVFSGSDLLISKSDSGNIISWCKLSFSLRTSSHMFFLHIKSGTFSYHVKLKRKIYPIEVFAMFRILIEKSFNASFFPLIFRINLN